MKNLKLVLVIIAFFGMLSAGNAQRIVKVYPKHGTVVTTVHKPTYSSSQGDQLSFCLRNMV